MAINWWSALKTISIRNKPYYFNRTDKIDYISSLEINQTQFEQC